MEYSFNCGGSGGLPHKGRIVSIALCCIEQRGDNQVDRSRGKNRSARHYVFSILFHMSTCQTVYQG